MSLPLSAFLILYIGVIGLYLVLSFFSLYHILRFGFMDAPTKCVLVLYFVVTFGILIGSGIFIAGIDWSERIVLFEIPDIRLSL